jgi:hypothetical protein
MKIEQIIDYALPCMLAENALKEVHLSMLDKNYDDALNECFKAMTNIAKIMEAIKHERSCIQSH